MPPLFVQSLGTLSFLFILSTQSVGGNKISVKTDNNVNEIVGAVKKSIQSTMSMGAEGIRVCVAGRLNGNEIARANIGTPGIIPNYDDGAYDWREAEIYTGGYPDEYEINFESNLLTNEDNVLAIQIHNYNI